MCLSTPTPTNPASLENDPRPLVNDLLAEHAKEIANVREAVQKDPLYKDCYDDIWILRFVLSFGQNSTEAALKAMKYRDEHKLNEMGDIRHKVYNHNPSPSLEDHSLAIHKDYYQKYAQPNATKITLPDPDKGVITYLFPARLEMGKVAKKAPKEFAAVEMLTNEAIFQIMDEVTRRTGRLTKCIRIMDGTNLSLFGLDRKFVMLDAAASKDLEAYYPQLLDKVMVVNSPGWVKTTWGTLKHFFPKSMAEKYDFCEPSKDKRALDRLEKYIAKEHLNERYGGEANEWPLVSAAETFRSNVE